MKLQDAITEFLVSVRAERGLATNTASAYRRDLDQYRQHLLKVGIESVDQVVGDDVSGYVTALTERGLAASTIARKVAAVRGLHRFLVAEDMASSDPTALVASPKRKAGIPKALTIDEVERLIGAADGDSAIAARDTALLEFMYASGARVAETVGLELLDLDLDESTALVTGKGSKQRLVPLGGPAVAAMRLYLRRRLDLKGDRQDPGAVFLSTRGRRLTRQSVWQLVRKYADKAGIDKAKVSPHVLRHSVATHMVEGGADLRTVQEILGHASISTTQVYTRVSPQHLYEVYVEAHPRGS
ncbi:MAG: site-specific tyrosine recombinase XerD [Acidimicrobiia bacterium]|nr:site-specific tyrosine recombinase XerD [Acidimicrobiia bacterium]